LTTKNRTIRLVSVANTTPNTGESNMTRENKAYWNGYTTALVGQKFNTKGLIGKEVDEYCKGFRSGEQDRKTK
jgi:hypothetical protein